jgi:hypothetical protein
LLGARVFELIQRRTGGGARLVRVEGQGHRAFDPLRRQLAQRLVGERVPGRHRHHRSDGDAAPDQLRGDRVGLRGRLLANRRAPADPLIGGPRFGAAPLGDRARQPRLQEAEPPELDDVGIAEQPAQERLDILERRRSAQVHDHEADRRARAAGGGSARGRGVHAALTAATSASTASIGVSG